MQVVPQEKTIYDVTKVYIKNLRAYYDGYRRAFNEGGTSSSKTFSIIQALILIASHSPKPFLISVVSESFPHLSRGCIRDFMTIMGDTFEPKRWSYSKNIYTFANKSKIEFFAIDDPAKGKGGRRDILFINECNNTQYDAYRQLDMRTRYFTFLDWNPTAEFWVHENDLQNRPENCYIHSTYLDALNVLEPEVIANIESNKDLDENWWNVYGLGILGRLEHVIWPHWRKVSDLPEKQRAWGYGLDFGYSHPMALLKIVMADEGVYWKQMIHERRMTGDDLVERMSHLERADVFADGARPDLIEQLRRAGWNVIAADKSEGSVQSGLNTVRQKPLFITDDSIEIIKEVRGYCRKKDRLSGRVLEEPVKINDDGMDGGRYGTVGLVEVYGYPTASTDKDDSQDNFYNFRRV